jgi:hypothetical protein
MRHFYVAFMAAALALGAQQTPKTDVGTGVKDATIDFYDSMQDYFRQTNNAIRLISKKGIPDQEIPAVLHIARNSSASPNQIIEARLAGKSFEDIARANNVKWSGEGDFVTEANVKFLSSYHGRAEAEVRALKAKGGSWIDINQEFRRVGMPARTKTQRQQ